VSCVYVVLSCVGRGLCDGLITRPEESYRVAVCVLIRNLKEGGQGPIWDVEPLDGSLILKCSMLMGPRLSLLILNSLTLDPI
jgi:hypothetical protein